MSRLKRIIGHIASDVEGHYDGLKTRLIRRLNRDKPVLILPYIGYGTRNAVHLKGRVLEDKGLGSPMDDDTLWENLLNTYRRFNSNEIPGVQVRASFAGQVREFITDWEGYFDVEFTLKRPLPADRVWHEIDLELVGYPSSGERVEAVGQVVVPPPGAQFGVISDIDDTVLQTNVLHILKMARNVFLRNARTRLPFEGVAAFYRALQTGTRATFNPIFYLSSSPWNLYDLLVDFFEIRGIPLGPLFLVDLGITPEQFIVPTHTAHKSAHITRLLATYPQLPFILIGDSTQRDPEIYTQAAVENAGRILAIYIRDMAGERRHAQLEQFALQARDAGTEMVLVADTGEAARHAAAHGYILPEALAEVDAECAEDKEEPTILEQLLEADAG